MVNERHVSSPQHYSNQYADCCVVGVKYSVRTTELLTDNSYCTLSSSVTNGLCSIESLDPTAV